MQNGQDLKSPSNDYLDGLIGHVYNDSEAPDGAWIQRMVDIVQMDQGISPIDAHKMVMNYIQWKSDQE